MAEDRRKMNKQSTGTVPKTKSRNNSSYTNTNDRDSSRSYWTNNLNTADFHRLNLSDYLRNSSSSCTTTTRNLPQHSPNYGTSTMNTATLEEQTSSSLRQMNTSATGSLTPNTSSSTSRRNSSGTVPKCDNITKCPDKKQIEDKLSQIREYLQITTSLMSSMKNTDDQCNDTEEEKKSLSRMINDLKDSERKLVDILDTMNELDMKTNEIIEKNEQIIENGLVDDYADNSNHNELDDKIEHTNREMDILRDQQMTLLSLQQKAQNKLRDARQIQDKLMMAQYGNDMNNSSNQRDKNFEAVDAAIKDLEERSKRLKDPRIQQPSNLEDNLLAEVDSLHNQIVSLHDVNEDRQQLIEVLDNRDAELKAQHQELQQKLSELHNKKMQVDHLVSQLQHLDEAEDEDVGGQVRKIVLMKDQLSKLKDMLNIVNTSDNNGEDIEQACSVCHKSDDVNSTEHNNSRIRMKQVNKNSTPIIDHRQNGFGGAKPRVITPTNANKFAVQAELQAKKRELEEIMGKHKAGTSNLNHDVGNDTKSELSYESGQGWTPLMCEHNRFDSSERYSSDDCPEYADLNISRNQSFSLPVLNHPMNRSKTRQHRSDHGSVRLTPHDCDVLSTSTQLPHPPLNGRNLRSNSMAASVGRERPRSNSEQDGNKNQVQKQLELIRSVCDSMLDQQSINGQQLRNNLTPSPSPIFCEPRRFVPSPYPHQMNALNVVENPWVGANHQPDWFSNNALQTQAFMLNTLNQCCQMLWLQQRELMALRQSVTQLQDGFDLASPVQPIGPNEVRSGSNSKANHVPNACSMPNLNQYNIPSVNLDPCYVNNMHHQPNGRLQLDSCLNNANINQQQQHQAMAAPPPQPQPQPLPPQNQMWNGQALNNQVAPGNRANNYWDNFRSYSRQNLLSTTTATTNTNCKSNEGLQSSPFSALMSWSKSNSGCANTSHDNTPQHGHRRTQLLRHTDNRNNSVSAAAAVPDVLNVNHNVTSQPSVPPAVDVANQRRLYNESTSTNSNASDDNNGRRADDSSKLFEELRENVYKEVVTLISANEEHPHFLIQLFRDLQMVSSDPLRSKILQSIQTVITHSLVSSTQVVNHRPILDQPVLPDCFSLQPTVWSKSRKNSLLRGTDTDNYEMKDVLKDMISFLNDHDDEVITHHLLLSLEQVLVKSDSFKATVRDSVFEKHFNNILDEVLTQFLGKKVHDVKVPLIQSVNDLLCGELSFIQLIHDTCPENPENGIFNDELMTNQVNDAAPPIQNGDLAEADQGRVDNDDDGGGGGGGVVGGGGNDCGEEVEEEGAVGGFWDQIEQPIAGQNQIVQVSCDEVDGAEFQSNSEVFIKQGLDQVPTRLPTKSRSNTPSRDRSTSSRSDHPESF